MPYPRLDGLRLLLADDHMAVRMGFRLLFESVGALIVGEVCRGEEVCACHERCQPDVLVMDVSMPGIGGLGALERLLSKAPGARVLMLSAHEDTQIPARAMKLGALAYLSKATDPAELIRAIAQVHQGKRHLDPQLATRLAVASLAGQQHPADCLSEKEFTVFLQLAQGKSVNEVAASHHLSPSTVGTHLYHIKQKLQINNGAELALLAVRTGLLEPAAV